jgi:hypothetical protein
LGIPRGTLSLSTTRRERRRIIEMRKIFSIYLPATMLSAFLAMVLLTCGGGGGDSGSASTATLTGLSISGPSSMPEYGTATYTATASWDDTTTSTVTPTWSVDSQMATIGTDGCLACQGGIDSDQTVTITATYTSGEITKTATMDVTITHVSAPHIPFTNEELSGKAFFQESSEGGGYSSFLYILNDDSSLDLYATFALPRGDTSYNVSGTWSNDPDGLFLDFRLADHGPYTIRRIADSSYEMEVEIYQYPFGTHSATWEKIVEVTPAALPGTYSGSDGYTWVFNADGTGSVSIFGGTSFTWSVDSDGVLRMPGATGYTMSLYVRATSTAWGIYADLKAAFTEHNTSTGGFYAYYGGIELTRQ